MPGLKASGFRMQLVRQFWTPQVSRMLRLTVPVAVGASVLQLSVLLDKGISYVLMEKRAVIGGPLIQYFHLFGHAIRYPMDEGAPVRLGYAQFLYQFPLGVFAIALATAIFPGLSANALQEDKKAFKEVMRHGIEATLWEGLPASIGLILIAGPAARLLFQHGQIGRVDANWIASSTRWYSGAIWAFSLLQIVNRAYYALHDTVTPLVMAIINILVNLVVEIPLLWWMGESGMAVGTLVSFIIQALWMLYLLDRRVGGLGLRESAWPIAKMILATAVMTGVCLAIKYSPLYPHGAGRQIWFEQLLLVMVAGAFVYLGLCTAMGVNVMRRMK
jgi:putative peptidoglycan lipid II flippase